MNVRFMRLLLFFDLPTETSMDLKRYRDFIKFLKKDGYMRMQYSVYTKLCINADAAVTVSKRLKKNYPNKGDIRFMVVTENQYQNIEILNKTHRLQEKITNINRMLIIGGDKDVD